MIQFAVTLVLATAIAFGSAVAAEDAQQPATEFKVHPIGHVKKADLKPFAPGQDLASGVKVPKWAGPK